jgi:hypothetical protein
MSAMNVTKVTLSTKKVVLLRELKIKHTELAAQEVSSRAGGDANVLGLLMQKALVKQLIVQIDGKPVTSAELEDLDNLLTIGEYGQLLKVVRKLMGDDDSGKEPTLEVVSSGDK